MTFRMPNPSPRLAKGFALAGLAVVFATDTVTPLGFAHASLYAPFVAAAGFSRSDRWVLSVTLASLGLALAGFFLSLPAPIDADLTYLIANRLIAALLIATTGGLTLVVLRYVRQVNASQQALSDTYETLRSQQTLLQIASEVGRVGAG